MLDKRSCIVVAAWPKASFSKEPALFGGKLYNLHSKRVHIHFFLSKKATKNEVNYCFRQIATAAEKASSWLGKFVESLPSLFDVHGKIAMRCGLSTWRACLRNSLHISLHLLQGVRPHKSDRKSATIFAVATVAPPAELQLHNGLAKAPTDFEYDAVIIGSGIGGLTTATQLAAKGAKVVVLEKYASFVLIRRPCACLKMASMRLYDACDA